MNYRDMTPEQKASKQASTRKWQVAHPDWRTPRPERKRTLTRKWQVTHPERIKQLGRKAKLHAYGLTIAQYDQLVLDQNNLCAICGKSETKIRYGKVIALSVDHDHVTGKIRKLLCNACNTALGILCEDRQIVQNMDKYLAEHGK